MKAVFGKWELIGVGDLNRLLKPFGCRLVKKTSKEWQGQVTITAQGTAASATIIVPVQNVARDEAVLLLKNLSQVWAAAGSTELPRMGSHLYDVMNEVDNFLAKVPA